MPEPGVEDLAPASVLAYADRVDAAPDGCSSLRRRGLAGRVRGVRRVERELHHEVLREFWPVSFTDHSHHRDFGATTLGASVERSWRRQVRPVPRNTLS